MAVSVINQWPISQINAYAPQTYPSGNTSGSLNTTGNALLACIGWTANNYTQVAQPISYVADDAHNYWFHLATSQSATTLGSNSRCSWWLCPNATAAELFSVACSSYVLGLTAEIFEVPGLPNLAYMDAQASNYSASTNSLVVSGASVTAGDILFSVCHIPNTNITVTTPSGWTALNTVSAYDSGFGHAGPNDSVIAPFWRTAASTGAVSVTFGMSGTAPASGVLVSIPTTGQTVTLQRASRPAVKVEAAFNSQPGRAQAPQVYSDITQYAIGNQGDMIISASRGRQYENTAAEAGEITVQLDNHTGLFTPGYAGAIASPLLLNTPMRVTAVWNGKQYAVCAGHVERWPQTWTDPQWGMTPMEATDALGPLSNINLPSGLQGEILLDNPYVYCVCGENYSEANGLRCSNIARGNQRAATYMDAIISYSPVSTRPLATGLGLNLLGDMNTGVGYSSITTGPDVSPMPGVFYVDPGLNTVLSGANGCTFGWWMTIPTNRNSATPMEVFRLQGNSPNYYIGAVTTGGFGNRIVVFLNGNSGIGIIAADYAGHYQQYSWSQTVADGNAHHYMFTVTSTSNANVTITGYLDGVQKFSSTTAVLTGTTNDVFWMSWGPQMYWNGASAQGNNFTIGQVALWPAVLPYTRIQKQYNTGAMGAGGDSACTRFGKLLSWGNYTGPRACSNASPSPQLGPADQIQQTTIASSLQTLAQTDGGMAYVDGSGNATYWSRQFMYNRPVKWTFSDAQPQQLNINSAFDSGTGPWTAFNATATLSSSFAQSGLNSCKITPSGSGQAYIQSEQLTVTGNTNYQVQSWGYSPGGYSFFAIGVNWYTSLGAFISSSAATIALPAGVWELNSQVFTSPANAGQAYVLVVEQGSPTTGNVFYVDGAGMWTIPTSAPYDPSSSFDYDNSFVYNIVQSQRSANAGNFADVGRFNPVSQTWTVAGYGVLVNQYDQTSQWEYFPRGPLELDVETNSDQDAYDIVNWSLVDYKEPRFRVAEIVLTPSTNPTLWVTALSVEQGDVAVVSRTPLGGAPISTTVVIQSVKHEIDADNWKTTLMATPYFPGNAVLQCDVAGFDVVGSNALAW